MGSDLTLLARDYIVFTCFSTEYLLLLKELVQSLVGAYEEHIMTMDPDKGGSKQTTECTEIIYKIYKNVEI